MAQKKRRRQVRAGRKIPARVIRAAEDQWLATPFLVMDTRIVRKRFAKFTAAMPDVQVYYAVKANPAPEVLQVINDLGGRFDIASPAELGDAILAGAKPRHLSYANTVRKPADIAGAHMAGVGMFSFDSAAELRKLAEFAPGARVFTRLEVPNTGSALPLSNKFGTEAHEAARLLVKAREFGLEPHGVSFHVGSQQHDPQAYVFGLQVAADVFKMAGLEGVELKMVNIGGGFPASGYANRAPDIAEFGALIEDALHNMFDMGKVTFAAEPGRYMVADAGWMVGEVIGDSVRVTRLGKRRWVTIDSGIYQGLVEAADAAIEFNMAAVGAGGKGRPAIVAGPTCDSVDIFHSITPVCLPKLAPGDRVLIGSAGAYTLTTAAVAFNGFDPPHLVCV
jgi:ornithine decarboxylase